MKKVGIFFFSAVISASAFANILPVNPTQVRFAKKEFIQHMISVNHFNRTTLKNLFAPLHPNPKIIHAMTKPFEKQPWRFYRNFFLTPFRIALGAEYLKSHHAVLMHMQKKYGIPANIITAILGVETEYGMHLGAHHVLNALYTLGFYYPPREKFFRSELAQYLILTRDNHLNPKTLKGSYAGALGIPQFMPSSYRYFGVSYNKGGPVNLFRNNDAIASVANYFHKNGWLPNKPVVRLLPSKQAFLHQPRDARLMLRLKSGPQYWETYKNFKVIMTYNHNIVYAMAVYELSQAIEKKYESLY